MLWLEVTLKSALMSFGKVSVDGLSPTGRLPSKSMVTGLVGAALGIERSDVKSLQHIQDHLIVASALVTPGRILRDVQNTRLCLEPAWTTRGTPATRGGGAETLENSARRSKDYLEDAEVRLVIGLRDGTKITLEQIAEAFRRPYFPLSIGRKVCVPSAPLVPARNENCIFEAANAYEALSARLKDGVQARWPVGQGPDGGPSVTQVFGDPGLKDWQSGLHRGLDEVVEGVTGHVEVDIFDDEF